jgi:5'-methylthioadenosine phosphorylase/purine-nucleoside phosphorylase
MDGWAPAATFALVEAAARLAREAGTTVHVGPIVTSSVFYDPDETNVERWARLGHLGIEMEAAMLYTIAAVKGVEALAMMTVSDLVTEKASTRITDDELKRGVDNMMRIACRVAVS